MRSSVVREKKTKIVLLEKERSDNGYSTGLENRNPARDLWVRLPPSPP